jgi:tripartite ATP-independent transporter DctP family solute receptor
MLEAVKTGSQDMVLDPDAFLANYDDRFQVFSIPFVMTSWDQVKKFPGSDLQKKFDAIAEENGFVILGWTANGFRYFSTTKEVNTPNDLNGLKLRVGQNAVMASLYTTYGAQPTSMSMSEIYNAVQTGLVDGQENPIANIVGYKLYEVTPYICLTGHVYTWEPLIMSKAIFDSLTADQQKALKECGEKACAEDLEYCSTSEQADFDKCTAGGATIITPDKAVWQDAVKNFASEVCAKYGDEFTKLYNEYVALK